MDVIAADKYDGPHLEADGEKGFEDLVKVREIFEVNIARDAAFLAKEEHINAKEETVVEMEQDTEDLIFCVVRWCDETERQGGNRYRIGGRHR